MNFRSLVAGACITFLPILAEAQSSEISCGSTYTVVSGDTLSRISIRAYGVSAYQVLHDANRAAMGDNPNNLFVGQELIVPCRTETATNTTPASQIVAPVARATDGPVVLTFNKASDPRFVINVGIIDPYLELIERATEGRVTFEVPDVMNTKPQDQLALVTSGQVDATYVRNEFLADTHPLLQLPMIPLMGGSAEQTAISLWNLHENYLAETNYFDDAHLLGFVSAPTAHIWRRIDKPVQAGEGILSQNVYPVPYFEGLDTIGPMKVQEQNATKYGEASAEDALTFLLAHGAARGAGIWNDQMGVTEVENGIYTPTFSVIMSNEAWAKISPADQTIITNISGSALSLRSGAWDDFDNTHRQFLLDAGLDVSYPDGPLLREIEEAAQAGLAKWGQAASALGVPAQQAIAAYRADLASLRYLLIFR